MRMSEALNVVGPENLRLAGQQRSQRRARYLYHPGARVNLGIWSLLLIAVTTAVLCPTDRAFGDALQEIVVTAQKRDQAVQDIPITVTVLTADALVASDSKDLFQLANYVPGMVFSRAPDDGLALSFRGVGTGARSQAFDQSVALFLNGLFLAKGRLYSQALFDVRQIEFTKGTESSLLGKNASVGAISVVTREPGSTLAGEVLGTAEGEHGGGTVDGAIDVPLGDKAAVRVAGHYNDTNGWVRNTATGREVPVDKETGVRITGGWHPQESFDPILLGVPDVEFPRLDGLAGITIQVAGFLFTDSLAPNLGLECDADKGRPRGLLGPAHLVDELQQPIVDSHLNSLHHCGSECGVESTL